MAAPNPRSPTATSTGKPTTEAPRAPAAGKGSGGGGPTAAGGYNYQAAVTAITMAYAARGAPLGWLDGLADDTPVSVASETGSGGDDIRLVLMNGDVVDLQVKKGLTKGNSLWTALIDLARALDTGAADYAVLVVDNSCSGTIRDDLAEDVRLLAQGSAPKGPGSDLAARLKANGLVPQTICERLRIVTVLATIDTTGDIKAARAELAALCVTKADAGAAWTKLYGEAHAMQAARWIRKRPAIAQILRSAGIALRDDPNASPTAVLERLARWTLANNREFSILGVAKPLAIETAFIPIVPFVREVEEVEAAGATSLAAAVAQYHDWDARLPGRDADTSDARALGRFYTRCVVVAGPGAGKSTMLSRVATAYAADGYAVLKASALAITRRMAAGESFEEALFDLALDGSGITAAQALTAGIDDWVVLIDGLDEAGVGQSILIDGIKRFGTGHSDARLILTTRPVGYYGTPLAGWRLYELPSISEEAVDRTLSSLLTHVLEPSDPRQCHIEELVKAATDKSSAGKAALRSPLMIGLAAALFSSKGSLEGSRTSFYRGVLDLVDSQPSARIVATPPGRKIRNRYLDALGWHLISQPEITADAVSSRVATLLAEELGAPPLKAEQDAEDCRLYWQALGVVEELRHGQDRALAFVHKTFGEYVAGRFLARATHGEQTAALAASTGDPGLREVIAFAAGQGLAPTMLARLIDEGITGEAGEERLLQALDMIVDTLPPVAEVVVAPVLTAAFDEATGDRRRPVAEIGVRLRQLAALYPDTLAPLARPLTGHPQAWTRLVALTVSQVAEPNLFSLDDWVEILMEISGSDDSDPPNSVRNFSTGDASVGLLQDFAADLAERIVKARPPVEADAIFERAFEGHDLQRAGFIIRMERLITGRAIKPWWSDWMKSKGPTAQLNMDDLAKTARATFIALSRGLQIAPVPSGRTPTPDSERPLYALSAFLNVVDFGGTSLPEIWPIEDFGEAEDVRWLWSSLARLANIREDELTEDALTLEAYLAGHDGEGLSAVFDRTLAVDLPSPVWAASRLLPPNPRLLEAALRRPSSMIIRPAYSIAASSGLDLVRDLTIRLLATGDALSLWAAAALTALLPGPEALDRLFEHAGRPLRSGSDHVLRQLAAVAPPDDPRWTTALENALLQPLTRAAMVAAEWAAAMPRIQDAPLLTQAYEYWRKDDVRDRANTFSRPSSPSPVLLKAILALSPEPWTRLVELHEGAPFGIREVARSAFGRLLVAKEGLDEVSRAIGADELPLAFVETAMQNLAVFSTEQIEVMLNSLGSSDAKRRLAIMALLASDHVEAARRTGLLEVLRKDTDVSVREKASSMGRRLSKELPPLA